MGIKRINEALLAISEHFNKIKSKDKRLKPSNNKNNSNNSNSMESILVVKLGHYKENSSFNSDKPNIIRILGPNKKNPGYYIGQDGKNYSDYELTNNFTFTPLFGNEEQIQANNKHNNIFAGIEELMGKPAEESPYNADVELSFHSADTQQIPETIASQIVEKKALPKKYGCEEALQKTNIDYLNIKSMETLGINKFRKEKLDIILPVDFNYNIEKLRQIIELLDLNKNEVLDYLVEQVNVDIALLLKTKLHSLIFNPQSIIEEPQENMTKHAYIETKIDIQEHIEKHNTIANPIIKNDYDGIAPNDNGQQKLENTEVLEQGILDIQDYINNLITQK